MTDTPRFRRRSIRLRDYDYTQQGAYFVTICTHNRVHWFGEIHNGVMVLNPYGRIVENEWEQTAQLRPNVELDAFAVMPNHFHGIVLITDAIVNPPVGAQCIAPLQINESVQSNVTAQPAKRGVTPNNVAANSLGAIVRGFKAAVTRAIHRLPNPPQVLWQRNYHEHIIRNVAEYDHIRAYTLDNPARWAEDRFYAV